MSIPQRLWLALPPFVLCVADAALTLRGQSAAYWNGDYASVLELNPLGRVLLERHPAAFVVGIAVYLGLLVAAALLLPRRGAILLTFVLTVGHVIGGAGWLAREGIIGFLLAIAFIVVAERLVGISWRRSGMDSSNSC
jgi:hypothetical protein